MSGELALATEDHPPLNTFLADARRKAEAGSPTSISIRRLVGHVNASRRGARVIEQIEQALDRHGLVTEPPFTSGWIDNRVKLRLAQSIEDSDDETPASSADPVSPTDVSLTVGSLKSASGDVVMIDRNCDLDLARVLMLRHDYSQLAVVSGGPRNLIGAVSWESIAKAGIRTPEIRLRDATVSARQVGEHEDLIGLIPTIVENGFVFVTGRDRALRGIVTTADLSHQFAVLANPFFLLGEIERRLRRILSARFEPSEIQAARDPIDDNRTVDSMHRLTLGEMVRHVENEANWARLGWPLERVASIKVLHEVREIRNEVSAYPVGSTWL